MSRHRQADVIVVGLGAMGSAVTAALAARGIDVLAFDRHHPPHELGSTHGESRITRLAIGEGAEYVPFALRSHELWRELEAQTGERLLEQPGGLILGPAGSAFLTRTRECARQFGIAHENLDAEQIEARFPMFSAEPGTEGYFEPEAGYVRPEAAVTAQLALARRHGARLNLGERVDGWQASADAVTVRTAGGTYSAAQLALCAGPWLPELAPEVRGVLAVYRQLLLWFAAARPIPRARELMPVFVWDFGTERDAHVHLAGFYGFPPLAGPEHGVKVATERYEQTTRPDDRQHPAAPAEAAAMHRDYLATRLPWLSGRLVRSVSCLYTNACDSRFLIDRHPEHENVHVVSPCSGHGFKHSPAIGEAVAQRVVGETPSLDLKPFSFDRAQPHPASAEA